MKKILTLMAAMSAASGAFAHDFNWNFASLKAIEDATKVQAELNTFLMVLKPTLRYKLTEMLKSQRTVWHLLVAHWMQTMFHSMFSKMTRL